MPSSLGRLLALIPSVAVFVGCSGADKARVAKLEAELQAAQVEIARLKGQQPNGKVDFAGKWDGQYVDSMKPTGNGQGVYEFGEDKDGQLTGKVSWVDKKGEKQEMKFSGERTGPDAMRIVGESGGYTYRYVGGMVRGDLMLGYTGHRGESEAHFGVSRLTRQKK